MPGIYYIDQENNYELKVNRDMILHVPEFRKIMQNPKHGNNFLYYTLLFCSRVPFGKMPLVARDLRVTQVVTSFPYSQNEPKNVKGFYKHKDFLEAQKQLELIDPDELWDLFMSTSTSIATIRKKRDKLDLSKMESMGEFDEYTALLDKLVKQYRDLEKDMAAGLKTQVTTQGAGAIKKMLEAGN